MSIFDSWQSMLVSIVALSPAASGFIFGSSQTTPSSRFNKTASDRIRSDALNRNSTEPLTARQAAFGEWYDNLPNRTSKQEYMQRYAEFRSQFAEPNTRNRRSTGDQKQLPQELTESINPTSWMNGGVEKKPAFAEWMEQIIFG